MEQDKVIVINRLSELKNRLPTSKKHDPIIIALGSGSNTAISIDEMINEILGDTVIGIYYVESEMNRLSSIQGW